MQALVEAIEFAFEGFDARRHLLALTEQAFPFVAAGEQGFQLFTNAADDRFAVAVDVVEHDDALAQPLGYQTLVHHLQRRVLLADDEQAALPANGVGDHVDDGLALAGPRRPLDQQAWALARLQHGGFLGRVAGDSEVAL
ncbi:hypothetical protein D3C72_1436930 [compost metagenome]